jgi:hypothetical protein
MKTLTTLALLGIVLAAAARVREVHTHRTTAKPRTKPVDVERWEGEGGGLPNGGPGAGVAVEPVPRADPEISHPSLGLAH